MFDIITIFQNSEVVPISIFLLSDVPVKIDISMDRIRRKTLISQERSLFDLTSYPGVEKYHCRGGVLGEVGLRV